MSFSYRFKVDTADKTFPAGETWEVICFRLEERLRFHSNQTFIKGHRADPDHSNKPPKPLAPCDLISVRG